MPSPDAIQNANEALGDQINREARSNPQSPYVGKFVGIANGKVVIVSEDLDEVDRVLDEIEPDSRKVFIADTSRDPEHVEYIWELF